MAKSKTLTFALAFGLWSSTAFSATLPEVFDRVMATNPVILASEKNVEIASENVKQERADFLPTITASGSIQDVDRDIEAGAETTTSPKSMGVALSQTLFAGGGEFYSYKSAKKLQDQAENEYKSSVQNILSSTADAYIAVLTSEDVYNLQGNQVNLLSEQLKLTKARFEQGEVTRTDVKQAEARLAQAQAARIQAKGNFRTARTALNNLVGEMVTDLSWPELAFELPTEYTPELGDKVLATHPDVVAAMSTFESSEYNVKASRGSHFPTISAVASYTDNRDTNIGKYDIGKYEEKVVGFEASIPLFSGGRIFSQVNESIATREQSRQNFDQVKRNVNQELVDAIELYNTAVASLSAFKKSANAASIAEKGVENEQMLGERTVLDLLDARQELLEARVNVAVAKGEVITRAFALLKALGELDVSDAKS